MKNPILSTTVLILALLLAPPAARAQSDGWFRTISDNGEFSIEVPAGYGFFTDRDGFSVSQFRDTYYLREMNMLNAYVDKTLLGFETYKASKGALDALVDGDVQSGGKLSNDKKNGVKFRQTVRDTPDFHAVRRYFYSKNYIYILTAAAREPLETAAMKRFFDSVRFDADGRLPDQTPRPTAFNALRATPIVIDKADAPPASGPASATDDGSIVTKLAIVAKPIPSYTDSARSSRQTGAIRMRITFSAEGRVTKLAVLEKLDENLFRQAVFAAIRIKFLPQERNGKPENTTKIVEYNFEI